MRTTIKPQPDYFGANLEAVMRSQPRTTRRIRWRLAGVPRLGLDALPLLAVLLVLVVVAVGGCGPEDDATQPAPSVAACAERMRADIAATGRVYESAPECAGLTEDELADVELGILADGLDDVQP